jgi:hypothetical protein
MSADWKQIERDILQRINIRSELEALGLRFRASEPNANGWLECYAIGRGEDKPSAAVCVAGEDKFLGRYTDLGGDDKCNFWELTARLGVAADWRAAREHFAIKAGVELPTPGRPKGTSKAAVEIAKLSKSEQLVKTCAAMAKWPETGWNKEALLLARPRSGSFFGARVFALPCYRLGNWDEPTAWKLRRFDSKPFKKGKAYCHGSSSGSVMLFGTPEQLAAATDIVFFEGESDPLCWAHLLPAGHIAIAIAGGANSTPKNLEALKGKRVHIVGHRDKPGQEGKNKLGRALLDAGLMPDDISEIELPYPVVQSHGKDAKDFRAEGKGWDDLAALDKPFVFGPVKPQIVVDIDQERVVDEAITALSCSENIFQRNGRLVQVVTDTRPPKCISRSTPAPRIIEVQLPRLSELLTTAADFVMTSTNKEGEEETKLIRVPKWVVEILAARGQWPVIRPIEAVVQVPVVRHDGSILDTPGFDEQTGLYFAPQIKFPPIPDNPTREDAIAARDQILAIVKDFPFKHEKDDSDQHRAAWFAAAIGPIVRHAVFGPYPLFAFDANSPGSGKTLLADIIGVIHTGARMPRTTSPGSESEMQKTITSIALAGEGMVLFDNVTGPFGGASIDAALTATSWSSRILGKSEMSGSLTLSTIWFLTANNVALAGDTARRVVHVRLQSRIENPEERGGFEHPDLLNWVQAERARLAVACCTIFKAYFAAGLPKTFERWGSFEAWSDIVRGAVVWVGLADPIATRKELRRNSDRTTATLRQLLKAWRSASGDEGMTAADAIKKINDPTSFADSYFDLRAALTEMLPTGKVIDSQAIGMKLHSLKDRICDGMFFMSEDDSTRNVKVWKVEQVEQTGDKFDQPCAGTSGTSGTENHTPVSPKINKESDGVITQTHVRGTQTSPVTPGGPGATACDHFDPDKWIRRQGNFHCPGCGKWIAKCQPSTAAFVDSA